MISNTISNRTVPGYKAKANCGPVNEGLKRFSTPRTNIRKSDDEVVLEIALPGVPKNAIDINVRERVLTVSVTKSNEENAQSKYIRREIPTAFGDVKYKLGENLNIDDMRAAMDQGVLTLTIPLHNPDDLKRKIEIQ